MFKNSFIVRIGLLFLALNAGLYLTIVALWSSIPFNEKNYHVSAHHYIHDSRVFGEPLQLIRSLALFDSQWYYSIASEGYPKNPTISKLDYKVFDGLTYAFPPLYPLLLAGINVVIDDIAWSAFLLSIIILIANGFSILYVVTKLFQKNIAAKTLLLVFTFPFGIFFRSYYSEGLFLLILIWFIYFFLQRRWLPAALLIGLLPVTRGLGNFLLPLFFVYVGIEVYEKKLSFRRAVLVGVIAVLPLILWMIHCHVKTGNFLYFYTIRKEWLPAKNPLFFNLKKLTQFFDLPWHSFFRSKIDFIVAFMTLGVLIKSYRKLPEKLWWISMCLWAGPLLFTDTISFSRFQSVSLPLFIYLAMALRGLSFIALTTVFYIGLLVVGLLFINWYWIG